jgi:Associated with zinc fingers.
MDPVIGLPISCSSATTVGTTTVTTTLNGNISALPTIYQQHSASSPCLTQANLYQSNINLNQNNPLFSQAGLDQHQSNPTIYTNQILPQDGFTQHNSNPALAAHQSSGATAKNISWQIVSSSKRKKNTSETSPNLKLKLKRYEPYNNPRPLITPSQYEPIAFDEDEDNEPPATTNSATSNQGTNMDTEMSQNTPINNKKVDPKPPPVFIQGVINYQQMIANILNVLKEDDYVCRSLANDVVKINPKTIDAYRALVSHLRGQNIMFHTYQAKQDKAYRVVLRHIHHSVPTSEIKEELQQLGYKVRNVTNVLKRITKDPLNLFFIDLEPSDDNKKIFDLQYFMHMKIAVEPPKKNKSIPQCTRCQNYGHTKAYCTRPYACVKCGGAHSSVSCAKTRETPAICALCEGSHPANYKGCTVYKDLQNLRNNSRPTAHRTHDDQTHVNSHQTRPVTQDISYSRVLQSNTNHPGQNQPQAYRTNNPEVDSNISLSTFLREFKTMFNQLIQSMMMNMLSTIISKLV